MTDLASRRTPSQVFRFLLVGGLNTCLTGGIFLALSSVVAPTLAYSAAFAIGITIAVVVTPRFVFRSRASTSQRVRYAGWYLAVYVFGLVIVSLLHDRLQLGNTAVAGLTTLATAGLSFVGARFLFEQRL